MLNECHAEPLPRDVEQVLRAELAAWALHHRLAAPQLEAIKQQIMREAQVESAELPYEWWQGFWADWGAALQRAVDCQPVLQASQQVRLALQYAFPHA